MTPLTDV